MQDLGDGADQAAWLSVGVMTSMPSENLTPAITFGKCSAEKQIGGAGNDG
jgi:hypothetical protein